ncbi:MAG: magnesium transporter [Candidatus Bathyarchaeia archaeon]
MAGLIIAFQLHLFQFSSWTIAVYPAVLSAKGVIMGLFSGRLSTALHLGTIYPRFLGNTKGFYKLFEAVIVVTFVASVMMSLISMMLGSLFWGVTFADFSDILFIVASTMTLGLSISLITIAVAFLTFKRGLDPDVVIYPIMSTTADIGITTYYVLILNLFFIFGTFGRYAVGSIGLLLLILVFYILPRNMKEEEFFKTVKESFLTLIFVVFIVNVTGTALSRISKIVENRKEIYTVYPALIDMIGDVGSVIGSTATTKLALGLLKPSFKAMHNHATQIFSSWTASIIMFISLSALSLFINGLFSLSKFIGFTFQLLTANIIAVTLIVLISFAVSILTFKKGLDPDNFVIPIESSLADSITSIALLIVLMLAS